MKKIYFILIFITILVSSCGVKNDTTSTDINISDDNIKNIEQKEDNIIIEENTKKESIEKEQNNFSNNILLEKDNIEYSNIKEYVENNEMVADELGLSLNDYVNSLTKYEKVYQELSDSLNNGDLSKSSSIKELLYKNYLIQEKITLEYNEFDNLINSEVIENNFESKELYESYVMPNGDIVNEEFKTQFEDFYLINQEQFGNDLIMAQNDFINMLNTQNLIDLGKCDKITNEIDKAFCLSENK